MTWLKVCGITRSEDAIAACRLGFNAIGMVFADSPRRLSPDDARRISRCLPSSILRVGVFADNDGGDVRRLFKYCQLDIVQFHGEESPEEVTRWGARAIKALRPRGPEDLEILDLYENAFAVLIDARDPVKLGGTGKLCDWTWAGAASKRGRVVLAGGLEPANIGQAIAQVRPFGVDVSSGVESGPGIKDEHLMYGFIKEARLAAYGMQAGEDRDAATRA